MGEIVWTVATLEEAVATPEEAGPRTDNGSELNKCCGLFVQFAGATIRRFQNRQYCGALRKWPEGSLPA